MSFCEAQKELLSAANRVNGSDGAQRMLTVLVADLRSTTTTPPGAVENPVRQADGTQPPLGRAEPLNGVLLPTLTGVTLDNKGSSPDQFAMDLGDWTVAGPVGGEAATTATGVMGMAEWDERRLRQTLNLEREALGQLQALIASLGDDPYREPLERHRGKLADAISNLEGLVGESWFDQA